MNRLPRRSFLTTCGSATVLAKLNGFTQLSQLAAASASLSPSPKSADSETLSLVRLIRKTPRTECVAVLIQQLQEGLSYQGFLAALFHSAAESQDLHLLAQLYAAHRISSRARVEDRLLPLFWGLDLIKRGQESVDSPSAMKPLTGPMPTPSEAEDAFRQSMKQGNKDDTERAAVVLSQIQGPQRTLLSLWDYAANDLGGTMGHLPIGLANATRTLNAIGWHHAEPALRYLAREMSRPEVDRTYPDNLARTERTAPLLPVDWKANIGNRTATLELFQILRSPDPSSAADYICRAISKDNVKAGAIWDAISLTAADLIFRYQTGGGVIGGNLIHATTSTNALRYGFDRLPATKQPLLLLLQAAGLLSDFFIRWPSEEGGLRDMNLVTDLAALPARDDGFDPVFSSLPFKSNHHDQQDPSERAASDKACRLAFQRLKSPARQQAFKRAARSLLCIKASEDPHDFKYPAAIFENSQQTSPEWRPYLLASSVHALHGKKSADTAALIAARQALA